MMSPAKELDISFFQCSLQLPTTKYHSDFFNISCPGVDPGCYVDFTDGELEFWLYIDQCESGAG